MAGIKGLKEWGIDEALEKEPSVRADGSFIVFRVNGVLFILGRRRIYQVLCQCAGYDIS